MNTARFGEPAPNSGGIVPHDETAFSISEDRIHLAVMYSSFRAELNGPDEPLSKISVSSFQVPVELAADAGISAYTALILGFVSKSAGARVSIWADLGGASASWELPFGEAIEGADFKRKMATFEDRLDLDTQPDRAPIGPYAGTVVVTVQRQAPTDSVLFQLDSIDIHIVA